MTLRNWIVDAVIASVFVVTGQLTAWRVIRDSNVPLHGSRLAAAALFLVVDGAVLFRRRAPLPALGVAMLAGVAQTWIGGTSSFFSGFVPAALLVCGVAARYALPIAIGAGLYAFLGLITIIALAEDLHFGSELPFSATVLTIATAVGQVVRLRGLQASSAIARADQLEGERERVLEEERARIARELHDVIAHSVSVMIVQAGAARLSLDGDRERATQAILAVERSGRQALDEMRRLLGILRRSENDGQLAPQPGLDDLDALLDQVEAAGLPVTVEVTGAPVELSPGADLSAYRIIQEALTNAIKHAGPTRAWLRLDYEPGALAIEVVDEGRGYRRANGAGHGLVGMRERVELYRGTLETGDAPGGGFRVAARLPVAP